MQILKQSTAVDVRVGPFVDATDGVTPETGVTLGAADQAEALKADGAAAVDISSNTFAAVLNSDGWYDLTLTASDTGTVGTLDIVIQDSSVCLPVFARFQVVEEKVYDGLFAASADFLSPTAMGNLEDTYDGTGYTDDNAPATQSQLDALTITGSAVNVSPLASPNGFSITTGTEDGGTTEDNVVALDGTTHQLSDATNTLDCRYIFDIGSNSLPTGVTFTGVYNGANDSFTISANTGTNGTPVWSQRGTINGSNSTQNVTHTFTLFAGDTLSDDVSRVEIRINGTGLSTASFDTDQVFVSKSVVNNSIGYANGAVWIDTTDGTAGTESYVNGTADNPVDNLADAITIASNLNLSRFELSPDSSITFAESHSGETWMGRGWTCALGSRDLSKTHIVHAKVSGACTSPSGEIHIENSHLDNPSFGGDTHLSGCKIDGTITLTATGNYVLEDCKSEVAGSSTPAIDMGAAVGATELSIRNWSGGLSISNIAAGDLVSLEGHGGTITINGTGGSVNVRGIFETIVDSSGGAVTIDQDADVITKLNTIDTVVDGIKAVTDVIPDSGALTTINTNVSDILTDTSTTIPATLATIDTEVGQILDDTGTSGVVLAGTPDVNVAQIAGNTSSATNLGASTRAQWTTTIATAASATSFTLTSAVTTDDTYIGRNIYFLAGSTLAGQFATITDYVGSTKTVTVGATELTTTPTALDEVVII